MPYRYFSAGYLVKDGKVLLVHHRKFNKWTPPGGHIEEDETPDQALIREWKEELDLDIDIVPAHGSAYSGDANTYIIPMPFHIDVESEGFDTPHVGYFFFVRLRNDNQMIRVSEKELHNARWFSKNELSDIPTFGQVVALAGYAIDRYPKGYNARS